MTQYQTIRYQVDDPLATITLNRPDQGNAFTPRMLLELRHALAAAEDDPRVVVILLTGAGSRFSVGLDMTYLSETAAGGAPGVQGSAELNASPGDDSYLQDLAADFGFVLRLRKPLVGVVNGVAAGLGFVFALLCDIRLAASSASFVTAFARRGLAAEYGISWLLPRLVGVAQTFELLWEDRMPAERARDIGLVNAVLPDDRLLAVSRERATAMAVACSPHSIKVMKEQVYRDLTSTFSDAYGRTLDRMSLCVDHSDFKEGVTSFVERRAPRFERIGKDNKPSTDCTGETS